MDDWRWIRLPAPSWSGRLFFRLPHYYALVIKALREINSVALIFLTHFFLLPLALLLPMKKIYDDAEMYQVALSFYGGRFQPVLLHLLPLLVRVLVTRVDGVTCIDSREGWLEKFYRQWHPLVQVIWNVPSGILESMPSIEESVAAKLPRHQVVAYVGGSFRQKGLHAALEACALIRKRYPEVLFLFIGRLFEDAEAISGLIESLGIQNNIRFLEQMPYENMIAHLRYAQIGLALHQPGFIYDLVSAGNGRKIFTYMQAGLPIVATNFGEIGLVVKKERCGLLVDTTKPEDISQAILFLLDHPEEAKKMGEKGRQAFLEKYNWEREEQKFLGLIEKVLED